MKKPTKSKNPAYRKPLNLAKCADNSTHGKKIKKIQSKTHVSVVVVFFVVVYVIVVFVVVVFVVVIIVVIIIVIILITIILIFRQEISILQVSKSMGGTMGYDRLQIK